MFNLDVFYTDENTGEYMRARFNYDTFVEAYAVMENYAKVGAHEGLILFYNGAEFLRLDPKATVPVF
jgi:hypothetical protein